METVLQEITGQLADLRASGSIDGGDVRLPGDRAAEILERNLRLGLVVPPPVLAGLDAARAQLGLR